MPVQELPIVVISAVDFEAFGCPYCGEHMNRVVEIHANGSTMNGCWRKQTCGRPFVVLYRGETISPFPTSASSSGPHYGLVAGHPLRPDPNKKREVPSWWHADGAAMHLAHFDLQALRVIIQNADASARLEIKYSEIDDDRGFDLDWILLAGPGPRDEVRGHRRFAVVDVEGAFALRVGCGDQKFAARFNATAGESGKYIRTGTFLNIPCPGTGLPGDPNISIEITDRMRAELEELVLGR